MNWTNVPQSAGPLPPPPNQTSSIQPSPASSYQNHQTSAAVTSSGRLQNSSTVKDEEKWWFEGNNCWYPYDDLQQIALEDEHQKGKKKKFDAVINNVKYTIDLQNMQQVQKNDPFKIRRIRRDTAAKIATLFPPRPNGSEINGTCYFIDLKNLIQVQKNDHTRCRHIIKHASADDGVRNRRRYSSSDDDDDDDEQSQSPMDSQTDQQSDSDKSFMSTIFTQLKDYLKISTTGAALLLFTTTLALIMMMPGMPIIAVSIAIVLYMIYLHV